jgi:hypothetical protein
VDRLVARIPNPFCVLFEVDEENPVRLSLPSHDALFLGSLLDLTSSRSSSAPVRSITAVPFDGSPVTAIVAKAEIPIQYEWNRLHEKDRPSNGWPDRDMGRVEYTRRGAAPNGQLANVRGHYV